jgi:hypothetical protein
MKTQVNETVAMDDLEAILAEVRGPQESDDVTEVVETIEGEASVEAAAPVAEAPKKKGKKAKTPKAAKAPKTPKAPKEPKPAAEPKAPRVFYGKDKVSRIAANVSPDFLVLTVQDAELTGEALTAAQSATMEIVKGMGDKVKNRATNLIEFASGKLPRLNNVGMTALRLLASEGQITTGDKGNLHAALLAKPYAPAAARAMGNNQLNAMRQLKLISLTSKGHYAPNGDSVLLSILASKLALSFPEPVAAAEAVTTDEAVAA